MRVSKVLLLKMRKLKRCIISLDTDCTIDYNKSKRRWSLWQKNSPPPTASNVNIMYMMIAWTITSVKWIWTRTRWRIFSTTTPITVLTIASLMNTIWPTNSNSMTDLLSDITSDVPTILRHAGLKSAYTGAWISSTGVFQSNCTVSFSCSPLFSWSSAITSACCKRRSLPIHTV